MGVGAAAGGGGSSAPAATSDSTPEPINNIGKVVIDGDPVQGSILEAKVSDLDGVVGEPVYTWTIDGVEVPNSNHRSLQLTQEHVGKEIYVIATYTDTFGQEVVVSTRVTIADTTAPGHTIVSIPEATDGINATEASDGVDVEVTLPSDAVAGDVITVSIDGSTSVSHTVTQGEIDAGTPVVVTLPEADITAAGQGAAVVTTTYTDPSGNAITPITTNVTIDTIIPGTGTETPASVSIPEATDGINAAEASDGVDVEVTLPSDAVAGDVITVSIDGSTPVSHTVTQGEIDAGIPVVVTLPEADITAAGQGAAVVTTTYTDPSGNAITPITTNVTIDTIIPGTGTETPASVSIPEATDGINAAEASDGVDVEVTLPSDAVAGDVITVSIDGSTSVSHTVTQGEIDAGVPVVVTLPEADITAAGQGAAVVTTTYTDPSGNAITPITTNVTIDTIIPGTGTETPASVSIPEATDGINAAEASDGVDVEVTLPSDAVAGDVITVSIDGSTSVSHTVTQGEIDAGVPVVVTLPEADITAAGQGAAVVTTTYTDPSGNAITPITTNVTIDTDAPADPTTIPMSYEDNIGAIRNSISTAPTTDDTQPGVNVGIGLTDTPKLYIDDISVVADYDSVRGTLTPVVHLVNGQTYTLTYTLTDEAGNESGQSPALVITIDTTLPDNTDGTGIDNTFISLTDDFAPVIGTIVDNAITNDSQPIYAGTAGTDVVEVVIFDNGAEIGRADVNSGAWTFTPASALSDSVHNFTVAAVDAAGNEGAQTAFASDENDTFTVDTSIVPIPVITTLSDDQGSLVDDFSTGVITDDTAPVINGTTVSVVLRFKCMIMVYY